jgi:hypothetical protein
MLRCFKALGAYYHSAMGSLRAEMSGFLETDNDLNKACLIASLIVILRSGIGSTSLQTKSLNYSDEPGGNYSSKGAA